ncbi:hypothetical protein D3C85_976730 [compost metagenome]
MQLKPVSVAVLNDQHGFAVVVLEACISELAKVFDQGFFQARRGLDLGRFLWAEAQHTRCIAVLEAQAIAQRPHLLGVALQQYRRRISLQPLVRGLVVVALIKKVIEGADCIRRVL